MRPTYIVGLRNFGPGFSGTRHNIGEAVLRHFGSSWRVCDRSHDACEVGLDVELLLPRTFMNLNGKAVKRKIAGKKEGIHLCVVHDELDLPLGKAKIKLGGSARGSVDSAEPQRNAVQRGSNSSSSSSR